MNHESTIIVRIGLYSALCVVIGFLFVPLPNIELITLFVFLGGYLYGVSNGLIIGVFSEFIYSAFNPWVPVWPFPRCSSDKLYHMELSVWQEALQVGRSIVLSLQQNGCIYSDSAGDF